MRILGIIPARYASTRLPGKPLLEILGKTMIQRVYEQAKKAGSLHDVVVATDDSRIFDHVKSFGGHVVMTADVHPSGTDRCREALKLIKGDFAYVINIQGDEPMIDPQQIDSLAAVLDGRVELATLIKTAIDHDDIASHNAVKVVLNTQGEALYFSRMMLPFVKGVEEKNWVTEHAYFLHVGMYAYRKDILEAVTKLAVSSLEKAESLEQLRWLENGYKIKCVLTEIQGQCVDTPEDLEKVKQLLKAENA
ncbi:MAG TPA: 3-deoxy-manno-octulosonate cytidylyltransferase [Flavipsychrobacter sp.]|nr:3-deoxy-manno-octulosonate cytidylyltransferase [Flavipsychrobacter sp.]